MRIKDLYQTGTPGLSFEVFPPKTDKSLDVLYCTASQLAKHRPVFISGTYGAGGSTRDKTLQMLDEIRRRFSVPVTAHFTCVGSTQTDVREWLTQATHLKVENIMALRGDPPEGETRFAQTPGGLSHANELVALIRREFSHFGIGVAGYPEAHREAPSPEADLLNLKRKVEAGADAVFTQLFFDDEDFFRFRDRCQALGIRVPIIPGLLPVLSLVQVRRITALCGAKLPDRLFDRLKTHEGDPDAQIEVGVDHARRQYQNLVRAGVPGVHFYVLNRSDTIRKILIA